VRDTAATARSRSAAAPPRSAASRSHRPRTGSARGRATSHASASCCLLPRRRRLLEVLVVDGPAVRHGELMLTRRYHAQYDRALRLQPATRGVAERGRCECAVAREVLLEVLGIAGVE